LTVLTGDCIEVMKTFPDNHFTNILTDPPYGLSFMGKEWDHSVPGKEFWVEALRVCKPGAIMLAFGGTRTYHRLACAIEDAGWQIRDCLMWNYGSGFPKSHNFGCKCTSHPVQYNHEKDTKNTSKMCQLPEGISQTGMLGEKNEESLLQLQLQRETQSENSSEIQQQWQRQTTSRIGNEIREESSLEGWNNIQENQGELHRSKICEMPEGISCNGQEGRLCDGASVSNGKTSKQDSSESGGSSSQGSQYQKQCNREPGTISGQSNPQNNRMATCEKCGGIVGFEGYGTALKPAYEPILLCMKPLDGTFAQNAEKWGVAGINIDACRINAKGDLLGRKNKPGQNGWKNSSGGDNRAMNDPIAACGRWPANTLFDEEAAEMLDEQSGILTTGSMKPQVHKKKNSIYSSWNIASPNGQESSKGGASRFFYCAKASSSERDGSTHPTMKPLKLLEYLLKLITPPQNALILDPFLGSGSTCVAAKNLGYESVGIEISEEYCDIAKARIK
jgi:DNA modification methylase